MVATALTFDVCKVSQPDEDPEEDEGQDGLRDVDGVVSHANEQPDVGKQGEGAGDGVDVHVLDLLDASFWVALFSLFLYEVSVVLVAHSQDRHSANDQQVEGG